MTRMIAPASNGVIEYPERDGKPMADNTRQFRWIQVLQGNLAALFRDRPDVFVAGDLLWYPEEGHPEIRIAPDVLVVFGRPKGDRGSYRQWEEGDIPLTVVFEILSPANDFFEMADKHAFYFDRGVAEFYLYDPESNRLAVYVRRGESLRRVWEENGFVSPRLGIRFDLSGPEMVVFYPDGRRFSSFEELANAQALAEQRVREAERRVEEVQRNAERQAELMRRILQGQATADERQELQQLLDSPPPPR